MPNRCDWCTGTELEQTYHDEEWGVPTHDDRTLFEFLVLEGAQAGLSWLTILKRREGYRKAYADWDVERIARYDDNDRARLLSDSGIIRNRLKVESSINNAQHFLAVQEEFGSFDRFIWRFTEGRTLRPEKPPEQMEDIPVTTPLAETISKDLRHRGLRFVGPVISYSYMQACGLVDDHMADCFKCALR